VEILESNLRYKGVGLLRMKVEAFLEVCEEI
jgi:hypothetical protein